MAKSPAVILYDANGVAMAVEDGVAIPLNTRALICAGKEGTNARFMRVAADGTVRIDPSGTTTQPISASSLPLPAGAATEATLLTRAASSQLPAALVGGRLDQNIGSWLGSTAPTVGQKSISDSIPVTISSDQPAINVTMSAPIDADANISFGEVTLTTVTTAAIRKTTYTEPTTNFTGSVVSSSANDSAAGTGARTIRIFWMDSTGASIGTEDATLNGTTPVNLVTSTKCFIEKILVLTVGSVGSNVGTISLYTGAGATGTLVGTIAIGDNRTLWAHHYVQSTKIFNLTGITAGSTATTSGAGSSYRLRARSISVANSVESQINDTLTLYGQSSQTTRNYITAIPAVTGPARVVLFCTTLASSSIVYRGSFDFYDD